MTNTLDAPNRLIVAERYKKGNSNHCQLPIAIIADCQLPIADWSKFLKQHSALAGGIYNRTSISKLAIGNDFNWQSEIGNVYRLLWWRALR